MAVRPKFFRAAGGQTLWILGREERIVPTLDKQLNIEPPVETGGSVSPKRTLLLLAALLATLSGLLVRLLILLTRLRLATLLAALSGLLVRLLGLLAALIWIVLGHSDLQFFVKQCLNVIIQTVHFS